MTARSYERLNSGLRLLKYFVGELDQYFPVFTAADHQTLDIDGHHGDGIVRDLSESGNYCYVSIHRWNDGKFFPAEGAHGSASPQADGTGLAV